MAVYEDLEKEGFRKTNSTGRLGMDNKKTDKKMDDEDEQNRDANANEVCLGEVEGEQPKDRNKNDNKDENDKDNDDDNEIAVIDEEEMLHFEYDDPEMQHDYTIILEPERATAIEKRWLYRCIHGPVSYTHLDVYKRQVRRLRERRIP